MSIKEARGIRTVETLRRGFGITDPDELEVALCYQILMKFYLHLGGTGQKCHVRYKNWIMPFT
jgi:hypothetical protein